MYASIVDLRYRMKDVLRAIDRGETVTVLYRGKPKAKLAPMEPLPGPSGARTPRTQDQPLFGLWKDREDLANPASYVRNLRRTRSALAQVRGKRQTPARKSK